MTKHVMSISTRKRGFTLSELAIVMGVVGSILGGIWYAASNAHEAQKENAAVTELQTVVSNYMSVNQGRDIADSNGGNLTPAFIANKIIPTQYIYKQNNAQANNPWSAGDFYAFYISARDLRLSFYQVPYAGCMALVQAATACQSGQSMCPTYITSNMATYPAVTAGAGWSTTMTTAVMQGICGANQEGTGGNNSVEFDFTP